MSAPKLGNDDYRDVIGQRRAATLGDRDDHQGQDDVRQDDRPAWPARPDPAAYTGLAGDLIKAIEPITEADPVAILVQFLVGIGNAIGRGPHFYVEDTRHGVNENVLIVAESAKGRKGTSEDRALGPIARADATWAEQRHAFGVSSGEGLIWSVRDAIYGLKPIRAAEKGGPVIDYDRQIVDPGVEDKRLLVRLGEFGSVLRLVERPGNTLSPIMRAAWDGKPLASLTKNSPARATGAHISTFGHITQDELRTINRTEVYNGLLNRFLIVSARRSKKLPDGGQLGYEADRYLTENVCQVLEFGRTAEEMVRDGDAQELWADIYDELSEGREGLLGHATSRAEAHVVRLSMVYALLDRTDVIGVDHLQAATAVVEYAERSAAYLLGTLTGDPQLDRLLRELERAGRSLTRTEVRDLYHRHGNTGAIIEKGVARGLLEVATEATEGRDREIIRLRSLSSQSLMGS
jgi:hypothetical protein